MKNDDKMGTKNILPLLVEFSIPAIIGMLVNAIYNIVDRMFIGNAPELGAIGLAGISICYPVTLILMAISLMIGMGGATRFSIALGQGKKEEAGKYMGNGLTLTIILGLVFMILGNVFLAPMLRLLGASKTVLPYAENYLSIILYGAVFQCIAMAGNNFSRAQGNPKNAMISQLIGAGFNILFDYILICIFHMGMQGAAFATIGGQFLSALWQLAFLFGKRTIIPLNATLLKLQLNISKQIIQTGIPAFLMQISNSVLNIILNASLVKYGGDLALSAIGIVTSIQTLILMPITGLMQGQQPLISYNYGANRPGRVRKAGVVMGCLILGYTAIMWTLIIVAPHFLIHIFSSDSALIADAVPALKLYFAAFIFMDLQYIGQTFFKSLNKKKHAIFFSLLRKVVIVVPLTYIFPYLFNMGSNGVFLAEPISNVIGGSMCFITMLCTILPELKRMENK